MTRVDRLFEWFRKYDYLGYSASGNDWDGDGWPNRADVDDGDGVDCSGSTYLAWAYAWEPNRSPIPLTSTSGLALLADHNNWWVGLNDLKRGDILLYAENGDVFHSDGPGGHVETFDQVVTSGKLRCWGSSGSGAGVGFKDRDRYWWTRAFRVPGLYDDTPPIITPEQWEALRRALEELDVEHGMAVRVINNPANPRQGYKLDRHGGVHAFGGAVPVPNVSYYRKGEDVARDIIITNWAKGRGFVMDLAGGLHPFNGEAEMPTDGYWPGAKIVPITEY
jgi:hypothetical protein